MQALFSTLERAPVPARPDTVLRTLSLERLAERLNELELAAVVPSCDRALRSRQLSDLAGRLCAEAALHALTGRDHLVDQQPDGTPCRPVRQHCKLATADCPECIVKGYGLVLITDKQQISYFSDPSPPSGIGATNIRRNGRLGVNSVIGKRHAALYGRCSQTAEPAKRP
ncbi:hypothetical protein QU487_22070 [Crenobacter sp. SG2305]|uniref:hypothetical protein n=1 Tax=Crenobacter oryzisoli TaxID=3056844 RepID=UPI0025AA4B0E|nr:hypothetical protein [Crenobacter sp. SG2305]MDN0085393.1 hypothetical protein [Crenobacter sp. SG2305]